MVRRQLVHGSLVVLVGILVLLCSQSGEGFRQRRTVFQPTAKHSFANGIHRANRGSTHFFQRHMLRSSDVPSSSSRGSSRSGTVLKSTTINTEFHYDGPDQYVAFQLSSKSFVPMPKEEDKIDHLRNQLDIDEIDGTGLVDEVTFDELRSRWLDICIDENCPDDFDNIRYDVLLPQLMSTGRHLRIVDKSDSKISMESVSATFITEFELNRLWRRHSLMGFSNLQEEFHIKNALLLVDDEMDEQLLQMGVDAKLLLAQQEQQQQMADYVQPSTEASATTKTETEPKVSTKGKGNKKSTDVDLMSVNAMPLPFEEDLEDDEELILTEHDLERLWDRRAPVAFGMPSPAFNVKDALMMIHDDNEIFSRTQYLNYYQASLQNKDYNPAEDFPQFSKTKANRVNRVLKSIFEDLEKFEINDKGWQKESNMLSPDFDTQVVAGDIMHTNTYMTTRLPGSREPDPTIKDEAFHASDSMAMPGEEETDYNKKDPLWVAIPHVNLPPRTPLAVLPTLTEHDYLLRTSDKYDPKAAKEAAKADKKKKRKPRIEDNDDEEEEEVEVDWENFDFSKSLPSGGESDDFFSLFDDASTNKPVMVDPAVLEEQAMLQEYHQEPDNYGVGGVSESVHRQLERNLVIQRQWKTPLAWLENEDFHNHVPFEVWGNYDQKLVVDHDDEVWDEDMYSKMAVNRLRNLTNFYLRDHLLIADKLNTIASKKRYLEELLDTNDMSLSYPTNQSIPNYLIPDKNRGVVYSDNLMELKSRIVLAPAVLPPKEAFGHEEFGYNDEVKPVNLVGTVRAQYDWTPDESLLPYSIEKSKLSYIQPILHFMGNVAELKSTKNNVLVFEYKGGVMRHVVGIRDAMLAVARKHCPKIKDIRLETNVLYDATDV